MSIMLLKGRDVLVKLTERAVIKMRHWQYQPTKGERDLIANPREPAGIAVTKDTTKISVLSLCA
jgi:hypothetical protein